MNIRLLFTFIFMVCFFSGFTQTGTRFEDLSLTEALSKAGEENKMLFVDCYTDWCGPCKEMSAHIFPQPEMGEFMNSHFICVQYDMEKGEGKAIAAKYHVQSLPTFLLLNPDGTERYRLIGKHNAADFIQKISRTLTLNTNLETLEKQYQNDELDKAGLLDYTLTLMDAGEYNKAIPAGQKLLALLQENERAAACYWPLYSYFLITPVTSEHFNFMIEHISEFERETGKQKVDDYLYRLYSAQLQEYVIGYLKNEKGENTQPPVELFQNQIKKLHLEKDRQIYLELKVALTLARCHNEIGQMTEVGNKLIEICPEEEVWPLAQFFLTIKTQDSKQLEALQALEKKFHDTLKDEKIKQFINGTFGTGKVGTKVSAATE